MTATRLDALARFAASLARLRERAGSPEKCLDS